MKTRNLSYCLIFLLLTGGICSCSGGKKDAGDEEKVIAAGTPVTVTTVSNDSLTQYIDLSATATFLQKHYIKSNVNGYIQSVNAAPGKYVSAGQTLFTVKTKEAMSIGNSINKLDPGFKFSGSNNIRADGSGYITQLNHQTGDYVQDGEQLAVISDDNSFAFILGLPYELRQYIKINGQIQLTLPDGAVLRGRVDALMPSVDPSAQTQNVVIKITGSHAIPENLIAKARIIKSSKTNTQSLPKSAILTNDVQSDFWVLKMIDSSTAVKVPVKKGMETADKVEITDPRFSPGDKIVVTGNYGLPDTAKVKVEQ
jgi:multidrug efflux pump subunit AcrA (membrane-fusion protein)